MVELSGLIQHSFKEVHQAHTHLCTSHDQLITSITQVDANSNMLHGSLSTLHSHLDTTMHNQVNHYTMIERV